MNLNPHLEEEFSPEDVRAGRTLHRITYLDINEPDSDEPRYLVEFWAKETERWQNEYYRLTEEIFYYNPFSDPANLVVMQAELAVIAANVIEASAALTSSLRLVNDLLEV